MEHGGPAEGDTTSTTWSSPPRLVDQGYGLAGPSFDRTVETRGRLVFASRRSLRRQSPGLRRTGHHRGATGDQCDHGHHGPGVGIRRPTGARRRRAVRAGPSQPACTGGATEGAGDEAVVVSATGAVSLLNYAYTLILLWLLPTREFAEAASISALLLICGTIAGAALPWVLAQEVLRSQRTTGSAAGWRSPSASFATVLQGAAAGLATCLIVMHYARAGAGGRLLLGLPHLHGRHRGRLLPGAPALPADRPAEGGRGGGQDRRRRRPHRPRRRGQRCGRRVRPGRGGGGRGRAGRHGPDITWSRSAMAGPPPVGQRPRV